jgi:hypothetical protein
MIYVIKFIDCKDIPGHHILDVHPGSNSRPGIPAGKRINLFQGLCREIQIELSFPEGCQDILIADIVLNIFSIISH